MRYLEFQQKQLEQFKELLHEIELGLKEDDRLDIKYDRAERLKRVDWYLSEISRLESTIAQPHKEAFENMAKTLSDSQRIIMHRDYILNPNSTNHPDFWLAKGQACVIDVLREFGMKGSQPVASMELIENVYDVRDVFFCMMVGFPLNYEQYLLWLAQTKEMHHATNLAIGVHVYRRWTYENEYPNWENDPSVNQDDGKYHHPDLNPLVRFNCIGSASIFVNKETFEVVSIEKEESDSPCFPNISSMGQVRTPRRIFNKE